MLRRTSTTRSLRGNFQLSDRLPRVQRLRSRYNDKASKRQGIFFCLLPKTFRRAMWRRQPSVALVTGAKRSRRKADHSPPSNAEVMNEWRFPVLPTRLLLLPKLSFNVAFYQQLMLYYKRQRVCTHSGRRRRIEHARYTSLLFREASLRAITPKLF